MPHAFNILLHQVMLSSDFVMADLCFLYIFEKINYKVRKIPYFSVFRTLYISAMSKGASPQVLLITL